MSISGFSCDSFELSPSKFHWSVVPVETVGAPNLSCFDEAVFSKWRGAAQKGRFKYDLNIEGSKILSGKWKFLVELNVQRGANRRKPQDLHSMSEAFNPALFNFTKIHSEEVLFKLKVSEQDLSPENEDLVAINVSPINENHCLLLPAVNKKHPQVLTEYSILLGLKVLLLSKSPALRVVFNSLCAYASVNHLHLHMLYINHSMLLESHGLLPLRGPCWQLVDYPGRAFVFQSEPQCEADIIHLSRNVHKLTHFLQTKNEAHNVCLTRSKANPDDTVLSAVRVYVWARTPSSGSKETSGFNPAVCELFGYILYKDRELYDKSCEDYIASVLDSITREPFERNVPLVEQLFSN